jgi:hypothetical protein
MFLLIENAILLILILIFVPLRKIAKAQDWVKTKAKNVKDKLDN